MNCEVDGGGYQPQAIKKTYFKNRKYIINQIFFFLKAVIKFHIYT